MPAAWIPVPEPADKTLPAPKASTPQGGVATAPLMVVPTAKPAPREVTNAGPATRAWVFTLEAMSSTVKLRAPSPMAAVSMKPFPSWALGASSSTCLSSSEIPDRAPTRMKGPKRCSPRKRVELKARPTLHIPAVDFGLREDGNGGGGHGHGLRGEADARRAEDHLGYTARIFVAGSADNRMGRAFDDRGGNIYVGGARGADEGHVIEEKPEHKCLIVHEGDLLDGGGIEFDV